MEKGQHHDRPGCEAGTAKKRPPTNRGERAAAHVEFRSPTRALNRRPVSTVAREPAIDGSGSRRYRGRPSSNVTEDAATSHHLALHSAVGAGS